MINREYASNPSHIDAFKVKAHSLLSHRLRIAIEVRLWRVVALAVTA